MWDQSADRMLLELREDAVFLFARQSMELLFCNAAAKSLPLEIPAEVVCSELFVDADINEMVEYTRRTGKISMQTLPPRAWFPGGTMLAVHTVAAERNGVEVIGVTLDKRTYGTPPEAMQMMQAVLTNSYFSALRIDLDDLSVSVIIDKEPLMNTQAKFRSYDDFVRLCANRWIHPEDRAQFLECFSPAQLRLCAGANTTPACTVRRMQEEGGCCWVSFSPAVVNEHIVLLLGKDSSELHLQQERSDRYCAELKTLSQRNQYILTGAAEVFRLMLHIELATGDTIVCTMHPALRPYFDLDTVYRYEAVFAALLALVHPEDKESLLQYATVEQLCMLTEPRVSLEYRRVEHGKDPDSSAKWTRSILTVQYDESGKPAEVIYAVQDIDRYRRRALAAKQSQALLLEQFNTLIRSRFLWFFDYDFETQVIHCHEIADKLMREPIDCAFGKFFEKVIMPACHPEDYKRVAMNTLPHMLGAAYTAGKRRITVDYRCKDENGSWIYVRAEIFLQGKGENITRAMLYISDIDKEVQSRDQVAKTEHEQLRLRSKFDQLVANSFVSIFEVDLDSDKLLHYDVCGGAITVRVDEMTFSEYQEEIIKRSVHPEHYEMVMNTFGYQAIRAAAREHVSELRRLIMVDLTGKQEYRWCRLTVRFFHDENGRPYLMGFSEDLNSAVEQFHHRMHEIEAESEQLQERIRKFEETRIRKAHLFLNMASSFRLALNRIYAPLEQCRQAYPEEHPALEDMLHAYELLSSMTEAAKDVLLLENGQLPLLREPTSLPLLIRGARDRGMSDFLRLGLKITSFVSHIKQETVLCDRGRVAYLLENIFVNVIRSLPYGASVTLRLSQTPIEGVRDRAMYEFSLVTYGDDASQNILSGIFSPLSTQNDPLRALEDMLDSKRSAADDLRQHNLYLSRRLISLMEGEMEYLRLPEQASAVILRLPMDYVPQQVIFPHRYCYGKRAFVWDSEQSSAMASMELIRETGMITEWQADFDHSLAYLRMAIAQQQPYAMIFVRQSDLNTQQRDCLGELRALLPETPIVIFENAPPAEHARLPEGDAHLCSIGTPVFRSELAKKLYEIAGIQ